MQRITLYQLRTLGASVLREEDSLLVINKPSGLLVIPDRYNPDEANLLSALMALGEEVYVVHRIDRETSGVLVLARTKEAHADLNQQFEEHSVDKRYLALCKGTSSIEKGVIDLPLGENPATHRMRPDRGAGKPSITEYTILQGLNGYSLVEARPKTGRTHQIRVHLAAIGLPIIGDALYGDGKPFRLSEIKRDYKKGKEAEKPLLSRTALHAANIVFRHPVTHQPVTLFADMPKDMRSALRAIEKYGQRTSAPLE